MKVEIVFEKRHLAYLIITVGILVGINYAIASSGDFGHSVSELGPGTFEAGAYVFPEGSTFTTMGYTFLAAEQDAKNIVHIGDPIGGRSDSRYPINLFGGDNDDDNNDWNHAYMGIDSPSGRLHIYPMSGSGNSKFNELRINFDNTGTGVLDVRGDIKSTGTVCDGSGNCLNNDLSCRTASSPLTAYSWGVTGTATCNSDEIRTGGGCQFNANLGHRTVSYNKPVDPRSWICAASGPYQSGLYAYAICCKIV